MVSEPLVLAAAANGISPRARRRTVSPSLRTGLCPCRLLALASAAAAGICSPPACTPPGHIRCDYTAADRGHRVLLSPMLCQHVHLCSPCHLCLQISSSRTAALCRACKLPIRILTTSTVTVEVVPIHFSYSSKGHVEATDASDGGGQTCGGLLRQGDDGLQARGAGSQR